MLGGTPDLSGRRRRRAARSRPALLTLPSVSLCGRDALRSGVIRAGSRGGAAQRSSLTAPFPHPLPAGGRGRRGPRAAAAAGGGPPQEAARWARAGPMWQPPCARGRRGGRRAGPLGRRRRLVPPLPHEARRAQATGMEAGQRARDTPPGKWPFLGSAPPGRAHAGTWETLGPGGSVSGQSLRRSASVPQSVSVCGLGRFTLTGSCCGTRGGWAGVSPGAADAPQLEPGPGLGRGRGRRALDGRDSTQGGTAGAPPAARGYLVCSCPWGTWALSQASGNCTSGAGGLGRPEGGSAAVRGCCLSPHLAS